jgi:hypothetical protein
LSCTLSHSFSSLYAQSAGDADETSDDYSFAGGVDAGDGSGDEDGDGSEDDEDDDDDDDAGSSDPSVEDGASEAEEEEEEDDEEDDEEDEEEDDSDGYEEDEDEVDKGKSSVKYNLYLQGMSGRLEAAEAEVIAVRQQAADQQFAAQLQADEFAKLKEEMTVYRARYHKQAKARRKQQEMFRSKLEQMKKMKKMKKMKESLKRKPEPPLTGRKKAKKGTVVKGNGKGKIGGTDLYDPPFHSPTMGKSKVESKGKGKIGGKAKGKGEGKGEGKGKGKGKGKITGKGKGAGKGVGKGESKSGRPPFGAFDAVTSTFHGSSAEVDQQEVLEQLEAIQDTEVYEGSRAFAKTVRNVILEVDPDYIIPASSSSADADTVALVSDCLADLCSPKRGGKRCFTQVGECDKDDHDEQKPRRALEMRARVSVKGDESGTNYMLFANLLRTLIPREEKGRVKAKFELKAGAAVPHFDMIREIEGRRWAVTFSNKKKDRYINITKLVPQDN